MLDSRISRNPKLYIIPSSPVVSTLDCNIMVPGFDSKRNPVSIIIDLNNFNIKNQNPDRKKAS